MTLWSVPPLRASVGAVGFVPAAPPSGFEIAPNGQPVVLYRPSKEAPFAFRMDANGQWWFPSGGTLIRTSTPTDEKGWQDTVWDVVTTYVAPALAGVLGTAVGGPVGPAAALALKTWISLARGATIGQTLVDQTISQTKSIVDKSVIQDSFNKIVSQNLSVSDIAKLRASMPDVDTQKAFDVATALAQGKRTQDKLVPMVRSNLPPDRVAGFDAAMAQGGILQDYVAAVSGTGALGRLDTLSTEAASSVQAAPTPPSGATGGGPSFGQDAVQIALVGGGVFLGYKYVWPVVKGWFRR